jgi:hypothetical protein
MKISILYNTMFKMNFIKNNEKKLLHHNKTTTEVSRCKNAYKCTNAIH